MSRKISAEVHEEPNSISIAVNSDLSITRSIPVPAVIDIGRSNEVVGIEILDLFTYVDKGALDSMVDVSEPRRDEVAYSYDAESDAFYLRIRSVDAPNQKSAQALLGLDGSGR